VILERDDRLVMDRARDDVLSLHLRGQPFGELQ